MAGEPLLMNVFPPRAVWKAEGEYKMFVDNAFKD